MGPANGTVSFLATADDFFRFTVGDKVLLDTIAAEGRTTATMLIGEVNMIQASPYH